MTVPTTVMIQSGDAKIRIMTACYFRSVVMSHERCPTQVMTRVAKSITKHLLNLHETKGMAVSFSHHSYEISMASASLSSCTVIRY